ncbi:regulator of chromosome condensation 1/beta-lactamase-inhibitor protein II [Staphylotrichum tortipilum]|uniref:Regulator of chromosome condensation 1/beta-lactamase-inhibitor protein II n=1 Tax=Staphylotrichum tortipilum TaxID=2831512 RepID=A0AAN6RSH9_9PEZI|nr:regulator of chromosome condensation 1/beta-lactamase-inhibitor protein II [Staphylotrichum longicolle]
MLLLQAFGSNGSGQLGIGHTEDVSTPQTVLLPAECLLPSPTGPTQQPRISRIVAGGNHTLVLFSTGTLLWSGDHTTGACGRVPDPAAATTPQFRPVDLGPLPPSSTVRLAAATWEASVAVVSSQVATHGSDCSSSETVYSFGRGGKGELGLGQGITTTGEEPAAIPNFPPPGSHVVDIAAGVGHVVAVLSNGEVWGWGNGRKGQLGEPAAAAIWAPRRINEGVGFRVVRAVCGREFTCLFGPSETGETVVLGSDKWGVRSRAPEHVSQWKDVGAGWGSLAVLKGDGTLVSWGRDDHGQLARDDLSRVKHMAVGSEHTMVLTKEGELMAWGWGEHGNCGPIRDGNGEKGERNRIATSGQGTEITMIGAGCATSWIAIEKAT